MLLPVNELFDTIQGEATWAGQPSTFIRLQGCDVGCPWCDTKHTWAQDEANAISFAHMLSKTKNDPTFAVATPWHIMNELGLRRTRHVVITGGEPCAHDLSEITEAALSLGASVQIETSGTQPIHAHPQAWVTLSPKIGMPGGFAVLPEAVGRANEIKMPVGKREDVSDLHHFLDRHHTLLPAGIPIWLQPLSMSGKATDVCITACRANNWRLSVQIHQFIGVR